MVSPSRLSHVVLKSADHKALIAWYAEFLRGKVVYENDFVAFMTYDEEHHRVGVAKIPGEAVEANPKSPGLSHVAFAFSNVFELLEHYSYLKSIGIKPASTVNHGPTLSCYYFDIDGNQVELLVDRFARAEDAAAWMYTDVYRTNPWGLPTEADELVAKMEAGASEEELLYFDEEAAYAFDFQAFMKQRS